MKINLRYLVPTIVALWGCASSADPSSQELETAEGDVATHVEETGGSSLSLGMSGAEVAELNATLRAIGYFPNPTLQDAYPAWRPIIARGPARDRTYDENTEAAIEAFQRSNGLAVTGVADEGVRNALRDRGCARPDGIAPIDPSSKFDVGVNGVFGIPRFSNASPITWRLLNTDDGFLQPEVNNAIQLAFSIWAAQGNVSFQMVGSGEQITLQFRDRAMGEVGDAVALFPGGQPTVSFFRDVAWSTQANPPAGVDLVRLAIHEIGHMLGMAHSGITDAMMFGGVPNRRTLHADDRAALISLYQTAWHLFPGNGFARDLGIGASGSLWAVGNNAIGSNDGFGVWLWNQGAAAWQPANLLPGNRGAIQIAVSPGGNPWVLTLDGRIYRKTIANLTSAWTEVQAGACAIDIAIGGPGSGTVWAVGCGQGQIPWRWNGSSFVAGTTLPSGNGGLASKIAVYPTGDPLALDLEGRVFRGNSTGTSWTELIGGGRASDIAIEPGGVIWALGKDSPDGANFNVWVYNTQPAAGGSPAAVAQNRWLRTPSGAALTIAAGPLGPMATTANFNIYRAGRP
jgi:hypothetical protein